MTQNANTKKKVTISVEPDVYEQLKVIASIDPTLTPSKVIELTVNDEPFKTSMITLATACREVKKAQTLMEELKNDTRRK